MKTINLVSESNFFKEEDFQVADFYGKEVVAFNVFEQNFINNSLVYGLFNNDLNPISCEVGKVGFAGYKRYYIQDNDIYIVLDKGTIGFESTTFVSKCHIEETETEFIVGIMIDNDADTVQRLLSLFEHNGCDAGGILHENLFNKISANPAPIPDLVKRVEETMFLDMDNDPGLKIPLLFQLDGEFCFETNSPYRLVDKESKITKGALLYSFPMQNTVEILKINGFAHSLYGDFYALVQPEYLYPRDSKALEENLPAFFKERCLFDHERRLREFIGNPESLAFIPVDSKIGDHEVYQELIVTKGRYGISNDVFQFTMNDCGANFYDGRCSGTDSIAVAHGAVVGTLIEVGGQFKIMFYKCVGVVKYRKTLYVHFVYDDESAFFKDFSNAGKSSFKKYHHRNACRNVEYLLCRDKIAPVSISKDQFAKFAGGR